MNTDTIWYGPHACAVCGVIIVKMAIEQGGQELEPPEALLRVFHRGSESSNQELVYPMTWAPHTHRENHGPQATTSPAEPAI